MRIVGDREALLEVIEDLRDRLSVYEREGDTVSFEDVKAKLDIDSSEEPGAQPVT